MSLPVLLDSRAVLAVNGADAETFLNGLLTCATLGLAPGETRAGALLTPQGKISAETLLTRTAEGFLIDCDAGAAPVLLKKLGLFRLRAAVAITPRDDLGVIVFDGEPDPRSPAAPRRRVVPREGASSGDAARHHVARIAACVPEQGADYGVDDVFPADVNMDLGPGIDFRKGCYVGQEVVSRMRRRGTARRRTLQVEFPGQGEPSGGAQPLAPILAADGSEVGVLTSRAGAHGLARVRIDRLGAGAASFTAGGSRLAILRPPWLADEIAAIAAAKEARA